MQLKQGGVIGGRKEKVDLKEISEIETIGLGNLNNAMK